MDDSGPGIQAEICEEGHADEFDRLAEELSKRGVGRVIYGDPPERQLNVVIGRDAGLALVVAHTLFQNVLRRDFAKDCVGLFDLLLYKNVPRLTGVDAPQDPWSG